MRGAYSSSSLFVLGCFDAKGAGAGAQQGRHRSNDWQGRYHSPDLLYSHVKFSSFSYNVSRFSFQFIIEKMVPAHLPKFSGCFLKEKDISTIKDEVGTHLQSKCVLHPSLAYHQICYIPSYLFLYFRQQTGQTLAEKALEDDRFDAKKWLNFHDVQVTA